MGMMIKRGLKRGIEPAHLSLRDFHELRNKILVLRQVGGLGDILMHRMIFEDFKSVMPDSHIVFACPKKYHRLVYDHPFIDEIVDVTEVDAREYLAVYNTSTICGRYESMMSPFSDRHRSDIWANHCGVELKNHNMHLSLRNEVVEKGREIVRGLTDKPNILFCPVSAMKNKNLQNEQVTEVVKGLREMGLFVFGSHTREIKELNKMEVPVVMGLNVEQWAGLVSAADYVLTVDTATFHLAGGLKKPTTAVFAWTDGKVYGKYYDFILVQKHRDNKDWDCGPCYLWTDCCKDKINNRKPCITEITSEMVLNGAKQMLKRWPKS